MPPSLRDCGKRVSLVVQADRSPDAQAANRRRADSVSPSSHSPTLCAQRLVRRRAFRLATIEESAKADFAPASVRACLLLRPSSRPGRWKRGSARSNETTLGTLARLLSAPEAGCRLSFWLRTCAVSHIIRSAGTLLTDISVDLSVAKGLAVVDVGGRHAGGVLRSPCGAQQTGALLLASGWPGLSAPPLSPGFVWLRSGSMTSAAGGSACATWCSVVWGCCGRPAGSHDRRRGCRP
jgi:hypothetical protein